jgi:hypothetical protein
VYEALQERRALLDSAPHLTATLPILMPCYAWWEVPFYWAGLKAYDVIAGALVVWRWGCGVAVGLWCVCVFVCGAGVCGWL